MSAPPGRTESKSESHARPLVEDGCTYSTTESYSCRLVEDEGGKCRECVRTRSTVRHCLGRAPEVLTTDEIRTKERGMPALGSGTNGSSMWSRAPGCPSELGGGVWGLGPGPGLGGVVGALGALGPSGQPAEQPPQGRSDSSQDSRSWPWAAGAWSASGPPDATSGPPDADAHVPRAGPEHAWEKPPVGEVLEGLVRHAEASARSLLEQLALDLDTFRPFQDLHSIWSPLASPGKHRAAASGDAGPAAAHREQGNRLDADAHVPRKPLYDVLSRDFDEV